MSEITWIKITDQLPPVGEKVLVLHVVVKQSFGGALKEGHVSGGDMEVMCLSAGSFYPGGLDIGWVSHWAHLPEKPEDLKIIDIG